jgi:hypothetical protein
MAKDTCERAEAERVSRFHLLFEFSIELKTGDIHTYRE